MEERFENFKGFQWDIGNSNKNLEKHNVHNWECEQIFFNRPLLIFSDLGHSQSERRWAGFGKTDRGRHLMVVFTKRGDLIRVISARDMNKKERSYYEKAEKE